MRTAVKRTLTILIIAVLSVCCGMTYDHICDRAERKKYPREYTTSVMRYSTNLGIPANTIYAVIKVESNFRSDLKTDTDGTVRIGLMQLSTDDYELYGEKLGINTDSGLLYEPETNLRIGCYRISVLYRKYTDWKCVFSAMRAGEDTVDEWLEDPSLTNDTTGKLQIIPDASVDEYVAAIEETVAEYNKLYG